MSVIQHIFDAYELRYNSKEGHEDALVLLVKREGEVAEDPADFYDGTIFTYGHSLGEVKMEHHSSISIPKVLIEDIPA